MDWEVFVEEARIDAEADGLFGSEAARRRSDSQCWSMMSWKRGHKSMFVALM